jgi:hypothetical protein
MQSPPGATLILPFTGKGRSRPLGRRSADAVPGRTTRHIVGAVVEARPQPCSITTLLIMSLSRASAMASRADIGAHVLGGPKTCTIAEVASHQVYPFLSRAFERSIKADH